MIGCDSIAISIWIGKHKPDVQRSWHCIATRGHNTGHGIIIDKDAIWPAPVVQLICNYIDLIDLTTTHQRSSMNGHQHFAYKTTPCLPNYLFKGFDLT